MTTYFDHAAKELDELFAKIAPGAETEGLDELLAFEDKMLQDVLLSAMHPAMPRDIRDAILRQVDRNMVFPRVWEMDAGQEYATTADLWRLMREEVHALHTLYHGVASACRQQDPCFNDNPRSALHFILEDADELRIQLRQGVPAPRYGTATVLVRLQALSDPMRAEQCVYDAVYEVALAVFQRGGTGGQRGDGERIAQDLADTAVARWRQAGEPQSIGHINNQPDPQEPTK